MNARRLLFASVHSYLDPSSGAAMASREVLELLTARDWDCRALTCGVLDYQRETTLDEVLATLELSAGRTSAALSRGGSAEVIDLEHGGVRVTLLPTHSSRAEKSPNPREGAVFLDLAGQVFDRFRPEVLLTYGGHPVSLELMRRARARGIAVVFHLHNFGYSSRRGFADVSAVIFPSEYSRRFHQRRIGLDGVVIPDPIRLDRVIAKNSEPTYVTLINPQPDKGVTVFAAIAMELSRRRPEIPLLVVEGRGTSDCAGEAAGGPVCAHQSQPDGQYARTARFLPGEPGRLDALLVARVTGPSGDGGDGRRHSRSGQRSGALARDAGECGFRVHDPRSLHAGK